MEQKKDGSERLLAIVSEQLDKVISENKDFYDKGGAQGTSAKDLPVDEDSGAQIEIVSKSLSRGDASRDGDQSKPHPEAAVKVVETVGAKLVAEPRANAYKSAGGSSHKHSRVMADGESEKPVRVVKKAVVEVAKPAEEKKKEEKADPINDNIKDDIEEEDGVLPIEQRKDPPQKDDDFDYDISAQPAPPNNPAIVEEERKNAPDKDPAAEKESPDSKVSQQASPSPKSSATDTDAKMNFELQTMLRANLGKKPLAGAVGSEVILEEGDEGESAAPSKIHNVRPSLAAPVQDENKERDSGEEASQIQQQRRGTGALPIARIIDAELSTVPQGPKKDKVPDPHKKEMLRQMTEEKARIKLKEEKLRDSTMGGVFMNSLSTRANAIIQSKANNVPAPVPVPANTLTNPDDSKEEEKGLLAKKSSGNPAAAALMMKKQAEIKKKTPKSVKVGEDEWDKANEQRHLEVERGETDEDKKAEGVTFASAWAELRSQDLSKEMAMIVREDTRYLNVFQKLFVGCMTRFKLDKNLCLERDTILALMKVKVSTDFHSCMLMRVFQLISMHAPPTETKNWVLIGFQGANPETDIRGSGMFGVLQVLYFAERFPKLTQHYLLMSIDPVQRFPLVVIMFGLTALSAEALREGRLTNLCNRKGSVIDIVNQFYAAAFCRLMARWERDKLTIVDQDAAKKENNAYCKANAKQLIEELGAQMHGK